MSYAFRKQSSHFDTLACRKRPDFFLSRIRSRRAAGNGPRDDSSRPSRTASHRSYPHAAAYEQIVDRRTVPELLGNLNGESGIAERRSVRRRLRRLAGIAQYGLHHGDRFALGMSVEIARAKHRIFVSRYGPDTPGKQFGRPEPRLTADVIEMGIEKIEHTPRAPVLHLGPCAYSVQGRIPPFGNGIGRLGEPKRAAVEYPETVRAIKDRRVFAPVSPVAAHTHRCETGHRAQIAHLGRLRFLHSQHVEAVKTDQRLDPFLAVRPRVVSVHRRVATDVVRTGNQLAAPGRKQGRHRPPRAAPTGRSSAVPCGRYFRIS